MTSNELKKKYSDDDKSPIKSFIYLEKTSAIKLILTIDENLKSIYGFLSGTMLLSEDVQKLASQLMQQQTPGTWQDQWEGPEDPLVYLSAVFERFRALDKWVSSVDSISQFLQQTLDLSELFRPDVFLNSLRQHAARDARVSMDGLKLVSSFSGPIRNIGLNVQITGLQLEGCNFDGHKLIECEENSPTVMSLPPCYIGWLQKEAAMPYDERRVISLPVYFNNSREKIITKLDIPCDGEHNKWLQLGSAFILRQL
jgi:dynein heavy chain 2